MSDRESPDLVPIPGGALRVPAEDPDASPADVVVPAFLLGRTQVTNADYDTFVRETGAEEPPFRRESPFSAAELPVVGVSWLDAAAYCEWLSARTGVRLRLPRDPEWEWAARGGVPGERYPWGNEDPRDRYSDYERLWRDGPEPVGRHLSNGFRLYEMCENVHEWCADWADEKRGRRASRGGSWRHQRKVSACAQRSSLPPQFRYADYGFRLAADAGETSA